ncbi:MAG TPA: toll/interleukin-1 receptor domain-containing protein [Candidatus Angelobacter sp.]|jgi:hypothetical protein
MLDYEADEWLQTEGGYKFHCFISWPHTINPEITESARYLKMAILERLAAVFPTPAVFLDESAMVGGDDWEKKLKHGLCRSVAMVAVCAPIYYHPQHRWCGREWAAMQLLSDYRLRTAEYTSIIPVLVRKSTPLPTAVSRIQHIDISNVTLQGRRYYNNREFREKIEQIVQRVRTIAMCIGSNKIKANCEGFDFPVESAFSDYVTSQPTLPLVT